MIKQMENLTLETLNTLESLATVLLGISVVAFFTFIIYTYNTI